MTDGPALLDRPQGRTPLAAWIGLLAVCALTLGLRLPGIDYQLPFATHIDGSVVIHQAARLSGEPVKSEFSGNTFYPQLLGWAATIASPLHDVAPVGRAEAAQHLRRAGRTWWEVRVVSVLLATLIVPATFLLARWFLSAGWALLAATLVATSLLHQVVSTQVRPHGAASSFILLTVVCALSLRRRPSVWAYLATGLFAGFALGSLHYGVFALPPLVMAYVLRERGTAGAPDTKRASGWWVLGSIAIVAVCIRVFYPMHFGEDRGYLQLEQARGLTALNLSGQPLYLRKFNGSGFPVIFETLWSYDPTLLFLGLFGAVAVAARHLTGGRSGGGGGSSDAGWKERIVILSHALPFFVVAGLYENTWERFVLQLLPYPALLAAVWASRALPRFARGRPALLVPLVLLLVMPSLAIAGKLVTLRLSADTRRQVADWMRAELTPEVRILAIPDFDLPMFYSAEALLENASRESTEWVEYMAQLPEEDFDGVRLTYFLPIGDRDEAFKELLRDPLAYLERHSIDYVVLPGRSRRRGYVASMSAALASAGSRVLYVHPGYAAGTEQLPNWRIRNHEVELLRPYFLRMLEVESLGPPIEVFAIEQPG